MCRAIGYIAIICLLNFFFLCNLHSIICICFSFIILLITFPIISFTASHICWSASSAWLHLLSSSYRCSMRIWRKWVNDFAKFHFNLGAVIFPLLLLLIFTVDIWNILDWHIVSLDERMVEVMITGIFYLTSVFLLWVPCKLSQYRSVSLKVKKAICERLSIRIAVDQKWILIYLEAHCCGFLTAKARTTMKNIIND